MAYARATVAGFEIDQLDDLIQFANSFGAVRLRYDTVKCLHHNLCFVA